MYRILLIALLLLVSGCSGPKSNSGPETRSQDTEKVQSTEEENLNSTSDQISSSTWLESITGILPWLLLFTVSILFYFYHRKKTKLVDKLESNIHKLEGKGRNYASLQNRMSENANKLRTLKGEKESLLNENEKLREELELLKSLERSRQSHRYNSSSNSESYANRENKLKDSRGKDNSSSPKNVEKTLYFSMPNKEGEFHHDKGAEELEGRRYYKLTYQENSKEGTLEYRSGSLDISAINQRDSILRPVCNIENSTMDSPSYIEKKSPGKVIRNGDVWKIEEKIKIRFQ